MPNQNIDCCTAMASQTPCPECGIDAWPVSAVTVQQVLREPALAKASGYAYCRNPECSSVYFDTRGHRYTIDDCNRPIYHKSRQPQDTICYCFSISAQQIISEHAAGHNTSFNLIKQKTREKQCDCTRQNPSGKCCLKDIHELLGNQPQS